MPTATKTKSVIPETGFYFDAEKHRYFMDGKKMTGVTTILSVISKPQLIQWAANEAVKYIKENVITADLFEGSSASGIYYPVSEEDLEKARTAHAKKRDKSADIGTLAHAWVEDWIAGKNPPKDENIALMTDNFLKWVGEVKPKFLASEKIVYSKKHFYAGTLDFVAEINGRTYLGDIKTGNGIYPEMFWQTAGYQLAFEETEPEMKIDAHIIVNTTKDGKLNLEEKFDFESSKQGFLSALKIYRLLNQ